MENLENWSDAQLLSKAMHYGEEARRWRNRFLGLLPEIHRRKLYEKQGYYSSIFVFAFKVGGVSEEQVRVVLNLERRFEDKPALHAALVTGKVSVNKLARVVSIATKENAEELVEKAKILPREALETYVRDAKISAIDGCQNTEIFPESLHVQSEASLVGIFELTAEVQEKLEELHLKGIDINEIILEALRQREEKIQEEKETIAEISTETDSRYIPARTRKILQQEHGTKCSIKTCNKSSEEIHHTQRFSVAKTHDPHYLAPLCKGHHTLAHLADQRYAKHMRNR